MSTPMPYQFIALRRLAAGTRQTRHLHMTGPSTFSSAIVIERPVLNLPRDVAGLRAEAKRRKLDHSGSKQELTSRISADELTHSRAFTTAIASSKRRSAAVAHAAGTPVRHFNTSRTLKAVKDSSPLDLAYLPAFDTEAEGASVIRVPLLPETDSSAHVISENIEAGNADVMKAEISSLSADGTFSAMADVHDNNAMHIDFHAVADAISSTTARVAEPVVEQGGLVKQLWNGVLDDVLGPKGRAAV